MSGVPTIDLFSGAGGLSLGATAAGADVRVMVDTDPISAETVRCNGSHGDAIVHEADVTTLSGQGLRELAGLASSDPLIMIGGPPCQPFSKAAYWSEEGGEAAYRRARAMGDHPVRPTAASPRPDPRRSLVEEFWRLVSESDADAFLMENVPSILSPRNRAEVDAVVNAAKASGYRVTISRLNAVDYGVSQRRNRVFFLGAKEHTPVAPAPTHGPWPEESTGLLPVLATESVLAPFEGWEFHEPEEVVEGRWADHLLEIPPGWNYKHHTEWAGHPDPTFVTETRFWHFLLKLHPDRPSWTIAANPGPWTGPFHWSSRRLRTPELAALQGFPDGYTFAGNRRERVRQIGNAVPPPLASAVLKELVKAMPADLDSAA